MKRQKIEEIRRALQPTMEYGSAMCLRRLKKGEDVKPDDLFRLDCTTQSSGKVVQYKDIPEGFVAVTILEVGSNE